MAIAGRFFLDKERIRQFPVALTSGSLNNIVPNGKGWMFVSSWNSRPGNGRRESDRYVVWAYVMPKKDTLIQMKSLGPALLRDVALTAPIGWSHSLTVLIRDADLSTISPVPFRSMPHLKPWTPTNITLLGDAIHNMPPTGGLGANLAFRDADNLTSSLIQASNGEVYVAEVIGSYENRMRDYANIAVGLSRRNAGDAASEKWPSRKFLGYS